MSRFGYIQYVRMERKVGQRGSSRGGKREMRRSKLCTVLSFFFFWLFDKAELVLCGVCSCIRIRCGAQAWECHGGAELVLADFQESHIKRGPAGCEKIVVTVKAMGISV